MDRPCDDGAGSHPLLFRLYRRHPGVVQHGRAGECAAVFVLPGGGLHPYPQQEKVFFESLCHLCGNVAAVLSHGLRRPAGPAGRLFPRKRHDDHLCDPDGGLAGHRLAGAKAAFARPCGGAAAPGLALRGHLAGGGVPGAFRPAGLCLLFGGAALGHDGRQQLAGAGHGSCALSFPQAQGRTGGCLYGLLSPVRRGLYGPYGLQYAGLCVDPALHCILRDLRRSGGAPDAVV